MGLFFHYLSQPYLLTGIVYTLLITALGLGGGLVMGLVLASMQLSRFRALALIARAYAIIFRGTPLILQMIFCYNALPLIGIKLTAIEAAGLALALNEAPFIAEIIRGNVIGVDRGQVLAGQALGMTPLVVMMRVVAPQAMRSMLPALGNEAVSALKNSSLASVVSVQELTLRSTQLASSTFDFFSVFIASGLMYLVLTGAIALIQIILEVLLDLDLPTPQARLARLLPWKRVRTRSSGAGGCARLVRPRCAAFPRQGRAADGPREASVGAREQQARGRDRRPHQILQRSARAEIAEPQSPGRRGHRAARPQRLWQEHASEVHQSARNLGQRDDPGVGARAWDRRERSPIVPREIAAARASVGVGMVFQNFNLFGHLTAKENVAGPLRWVQGLSRADADRRAVELLNRVGLGAHIDALPRHLSGGQQQRVAIARALAPNPSVLVLDEPTSALDPELVSEVLEVIRRLAVEDKLTMIISTHHISFAQEVADTAVFLTDGAIVEEGRADETLSRPKNPRTAQFLQIIAEEAKVAG